MPTYRDDIKLNNVNQFQQQIGISADKNAKGSSRNLKPLQEQMADQTMKVWRDAELNKLLNDVFIERDMIMNELEIPSLTFHCYVNEIRFYLLDSYTSKEIIYNRNKEIYILK